MFTTSLMALLALGNGVARLVSCAFTIKFYGTQFVVSTNFTDTANVYVNYSSTRGVRRSNKRLRALIEPSKPFNAT